MADYELQEIKIDVCDPIDDCEVTLIIDDIYYPVTADDINGSVITLRLATYQDYHIIVNCDKYINLRIDRWDIIDERDITVSADADYAFAGGILMFDY